MKRYKNYVNNEWVSGAGTREVFNPATSEPFAVVTEADKADVDRAVLAARTAFDTTNWRDSSQAMARGRVLFKMAELVRKNAAMFAELETLNSGKPIVESEFDMADVATCFEYFGGLATKVHGETLSVPDNALNFTLREPVGVAALIFNATATEMNAAADGLALASCSGVIAIGLWLTVTKGRALFAALKARFAHRAALAAAPVYADAPWRPASGSASLVAFRAGSPDDMATASADDPAVCGHLHAPDSATLEAGFSWRGAVATVLAAGSRPCSGAESPA